MGLLGSLAERLLTGTGGNPGANPQQNAIEGVLGVLNHPSVGGVGGLLQLFQNQGLGHLATGWVNNGPNPPVSPSQIQQVLGSAPIAEFAQKLGIPTDQAASHLAELLPHVVDHLTPNGTVPPPTGAGGGIDVQSVASMLKTKLFG